MTKPDLSPGATILCRQCGYDLSGVDLSRTAYICSECGEVNIPFDPVASPIVAPPWPNAALMAAVFLWPGAAMAIAAVGLINMGPLGSLLVFVIEALFVACIGWPVMYGHVLLSVRVPRMRRGRYLLLCAAAGIPANFTVAGGLLLAAAWARWV